MRSIALAVLVLASSGCCGTGGTASRSPPDYISPAESPLPATAPQAAAVSPVQAAAFETAAPHGEHSTADSPLPQPAPERGQTIAALPISAVRIQPQDAPPKLPEEVPAPSGMQLHEAIEISLWQNPDLVSMRQAEGVSLAAVGVAQTYPFNPFVQTQLFPSPRNKLGRTEAPAYYVWLMQTLELAHQRSYREQNANATLNQVRWNIHQAELLNMAQTERLFFSAVYQRQVRDLTRNAADLNERMVGVLERRFSANQTAAANVDRKSVV